MTPASRPRHRELVRRDGGGAWCGTAARCSRAAVHGQDALHRPTAAWCRSWPRATTSRQVSQVVRAALAEAGVARAGARRRRRDDGPRPAGLAPGRALVREGARVSARRAGGRRAPPGRPPRRGRAGGARRSRAPYLGLVVSGGHTALYRVEEGAPPKLLGETRDDAVGEAFDKVAKLLGLPFPGGPALARLAEGGREDAFALPRPRLGEPGYDFSYSGLKTAVAPHRARRASARRGHARGPRGVVPGGRDRRARARRRAARSRARRSRASPWWAASRRTSGSAARMEAAARADGFAAIFPPPALCTDNAAMIAAAGARAPRARASATTST